MKILFISPNLIWGGAATANINFAKMLKDNGHQVLYCDEYFKGNEYNELDIIHNHFHGDKFKSRELFYRQIEKIKPDVIVWIPMVAIYYYQEIYHLKKQGIKQIAIIHSLSLSDNLKGKFMDYLVSRVLARMDSNIFVSNYTLKSWEEFSSVRKSNSNKVVINNIVYNQNLTKRSINTPIRIGFVGRFSKEKQPGLYCKLSEISDYEYHAWGDGPLLDEMKVKYPKVIFHGLEVDLNLIYNNIDILLMTSKFENCPMVILESKSFGVPCVAPNVGGIPEIINHQYDGYLFDKYDYTLILKGIETVVNNYSVYSKCCLENSMFFSPQVIYEKWFNIL